MGSRDTAVRRSDDIGSQSKVRNLEWSKFVKLNAFALKVRLFIVPEVGLALLLQLRRGFLVWEGAL